MATARPFAYNPGATGPITGTEQVGSLAVGTPTAGFSATGLPWWNGPDEDLGYVIAQSVPGNTQPVPVGTGATGASVGFFRSSALTDPSFISLANVIAGPSGPFASGSTAKSWLNANGYWTSYGGATGATGGTGAFNVSITQVGNDVVWSGSGSFNTDSLTSNGTQTITAGFNNTLAIWIIGSGTPPGANHDIYSGVTTYPASMGTSASPGGSISGTGSSFGIINNLTNRDLYVPTGYVSGTQITGSTTYTSSTIAGLGLSGGTYTWAWGSGANASSLVMVIGGTGSTGATGATGAGWLFYAATGPLVDPPPTSDGQAIFTDNVPGDTNVTYNPNKSGGVDFLNFNLQDTDGVDYTTQFTTLQNSGGTVSVSQGSNTATYVLTTGMANINPSGFAAINTAAATQTVNASSSFVFGTPITIAFS